MRRAKHVIVAVGCVLFLVAGCREQAKVAEGPAVKAESKKAGPKIELDSAVYDFGKVGPRKKLNGEFKFTNTGDAPLKITKVEKCCGAVTQLDKTELAPGESGALKVQYTSSRSAGKIRKKLYIDSNDKTNPRAMLTIQAETVLRVDYEPKRIKLLLKDENAGCPDITLSSVDNKPFSVTSFKATNDALTAEIDPTVKATKFVLQPKADMEKLEKRSTGLINIALAFSEPDAESETVSIVFQALSRFTLRPSLLIVLYDKPGEPVKKTLWVTNNYGEDFEIESTSTKAGLVEVLSRKKVGSRYELDLEITPPSGPDTRRFSDTFTINLKGGEKLELPCRGIYRAPTTKKTAG
jgi:hypothetical protein